MKPDYDVLVIGGGHAGCEAAAAAARMGCHTLLLTFHSADVGYFAGNPAVGGAGRYQLVREIDALGGLMARCVDAAAVQVRVLHTGKGPASQALRAQIDRRRYCAAMLALLAATPNLDVCDGEAVALCPPTTAHTPWLVQTSHGPVTATTVVLAVGTFLDGEVGYGDERRAGGWHGQAAAQHLAQNLRSLGLRFDRFSTGTAPQIDGSKIDYDALDVQPVAHERLHFSAISPPVRSVLQRPCYLTMTTPALHALVRANVQQTPALNGSMPGAGPRHCPSIEKKIILFFPDVAAHRLFLEPVSSDTDELFVQGLETALPTALQQRMLRTIPALARSTVTTPGYGVTYAVLMSDHVGADLGVRMLPGLFCVGQMLGTSGAEEAAAQGIMAGINAALRVRGEAPLILGRDVAVIGVLINEITSTQLHAPQRMQPAQIEHRLALRSDNADLRLTPLAARLGLVPPVLAAAVEHKRHALTTIQHALRTHRLYPSAATNAQLTALGLAPLSKPTTAAELLRRPNVRYHQLQPLLGLPDVPPSAAETLAITACYAQVQVGEAA